METLLTSNHAQPSEAMSLALQARAWAMCKHDITDDILKDTLISQSVISRSLPALTPPPARSPAPRAPWVRRKYTDFH
jgi:hypothetical protein